MIKFKDAWSENIIFASLLALALGLLTSITILASFHLLLIVPALVFLFGRTRFKEWSKSTWALCFMVLVIILSVIVNQDIAYNGYKPILKSKYFIFGILSIAPFSFYFKRINFNQRKISILLYVFIIAATLATLAGEFRMHLNGIIEWLNWGRLGRNTGFFGMVLNYAHNMVYFLILIFGLILSKDKIEKFVNYRFLIIIFLINLFGLYRSYTRGAWLALLLGMSVYFLRKNYKWFIGSLLAASLFGALAYFLAGDAMHRTDNDNSRMGQWQAATYAFKERPFFGVGYLNFEHVCVIIKKHYGLLEPEFSGHAHNNFFEMLGSTGGLGALAYLSWLVFWFIEMFKRNDLIGKLGVPFIVTFIVSGFSQSTISLGINLFFVMGIYSLSQVNFKLVKDQV